MSEKMQNDPMDPTWKTYMQTLTKRMKNIEISEIIDQALWEWYSERGLEVPNWKSPPEPEWWQKQIGTWEDPDDQ